MFLRVFLRLLACLTVFLLESDDCRLVIVQRLKLHLYKDRVIDRPTFPFSYLNVATISKDSLVLVKRNEPLAPTGECIVVP